MPLHLTRPKYVRQEPKSPNRRVVNNHRARSSIPRIEEPVDDLFSPAPVKCLFAQIDRDFFAAYPRRIHFFRRMDQDEMYFVWNPWTYRELVEYWRPRGYEAVAFARRVLPGQSPPFRFSIEYRDTCRRKHPIHFVKSYALLPQIDGQHPRSWDEELCHRAYEFICDQPLMLFGSKMNWQTKKIINFTEQRLLLPSSRDEA